MNNIKCWCGNHDIIKYSPDYMRCPICNTLFSNEIFKYSGNIENYDSFYGKEYWFSHQEQDLNNPTILSRARTDLSERCIYWLRYFLKYNMPPGDVLEVGCAHGGFVALLNMAGFSAIGIEMSPWVVAFAKKSFDINVLLGDVRSHDFKHQSFMSISLFDVIEHLPDPLETMNHISSLINEKGTIVIQTPCFNRETTYEEMLENNDAFLKMLIKDEHLFLFSEKSIRLLLERCGLSYIYFEPAIFPQHDMFLIAGKTPLSIYSDSIIDEKLLSSSSGRFNLALLDKDKEYRTQLENSIELTKVVKKLNDDIQKYDVWLKEANDDIQKYDVWLKEANENIQKYDVWLKEAQSLIENYKNHLPKSSIYNLIRSIFSKKTK